MNAVFCTDKEKSITTYISMLKTFGKKKEIPMDTDIYSNVEEMFFHMEEKESKTDLIFLDVDIAGKSGFDAAETLRARELFGEVIFLTEREDQWEKAFDVQAFHYVIPKRCSQERFEWIVDRAVHKVLNKKEETLAFSCAGRRVVIPVRDIKYFECKERWINVFYEDEHFEFFSRISKIEEILTGKGFLKVHRSYLVAVQYIASVRYNCLSLQDGTEIPIARGKYPEVKAQSEKMKGD